MEVLISRRGSGSCCSRGVAGCVVLLCNGLGGLWQEGKMLLGVLSVSTVEKVLGFVQLLDAVMIGVA